ncbi:MAG TPA: rhodanese-like domain-containing protein [Candidatus Solibacter sp.]|jgi:rhodanese-related sulfurtransferase|nr:rhodanese-like domain-containing protein [Candidatus Solibacter sp.]
MDEHLTIDELLDQARAAIDRLSPAEALAAQKAGALIVDIRPLEQRRRDGDIPGAVLVDRNVLEWRLAPTSKWRLAEAADRELILVCNQGYQSSLAAHTLRRLGLATICDIDGGFEAWHATGMPVVEHAGADGAEVGD